MHIKAAHHDTFSFARLRRACLCLGGLAASALPLSAMAQTVPATAAPLSEPHIVSAAALNSGDTAGVLASTASSSRRRPNREHPAGHRSVAGQ
ncbi:hypothetical protein GALL_408630 [mine drainage metagenome]|uniref:Uncharacterized protein n=1 Tax=mine drainage metagenome TaxID=410659 RepID=A0A1J5QC03_9ZZZZ